MRDDIDKLPIPKVGKQYARLKGMSGLRKKQKLWYKLGDKLVNKGRKPGTFASKDVVGPVKHSFKTSRKKVAESIVDRLLSR